MKIKIGIQGEKELLAEIDRVTEEVKNKVLKVLEDAAHVVEGEAKKKSPINLGALRNSIHIEKIYEGNMREFRVGTNLEYAPYMEFGTGLLADYPSANKKRHAPFSPKAIANLKKWASDKGFEDPDSAAWATAFSIYLRGGLHPKAFLRNGFQKGKAYLLKELDKL